MKNDSAARITAAPGARIRLEIGFDWFPMDDGNPEYAEITMHKDYKEEFPIRATEIAGDRMVFAGCVPRSTQNGTYHATRIRMEADGHERIMILDDDKHPSVVVDGTKITSMNASVEPAGTRIAAETVRYRAAGRIERSTHIGATAWLVRGAAAGSGAVLAAAAIVETAKLAGFRW